MVATGLRGGASTASTGKSSRTSGLVNTEIFEGIPDADDHAGLVTVTLIEKDGRTFMDMLCEYRDKADRDAVIDSGMESGMQESMDALEQVAVTLDLRVHRVR
jgi:uncharacterized protein YndB with AHSA1/START domain